MSGEKKQYTFPSVSAYCLHVEDGGLGDDHRPVSSVPLQLGFGSLGRQFPRRIQRRFREGCESVLPHEFTKVLRHKP